MAGNGSYNFTITFCCMLQRCCAFFFVASEVKFEAMPIIDWSMIAWELLVDPIQVFLFNYKLSWLAYLKITKFCNIYFPESTRSWDNLLTSRTCTQFSALKKLLESLQQKSFHRLGCCSLLLTSLRKKTVKLWRNLLLLPLHVRQLMQHAFIYFYFYFHFHLCGKILPPNAGYSIESCSSSARQRGERWNTL